MEALDTREGVEGFNEQMEVLGSWQTVGIDLHEVSASSSFLRFILSFRPSASRRAAAIFACICSPDISDIVESDYPDGGDGSCDMKDSGRDRWDGLRGKSRELGKKGHHQVHGLDGLRPQDK